jgi:hypothetical protein
MSSAMLSTTEPWVSTDSAVATSGPARVCAGGMRVSTAPATGTRATHCRSDALRASAKGTKSTSDDRPRAPREPELQGERDGVALKLAGGGEWPPRRRGTGPEGP